MTISVEKEVQVCVGAAVNDPSGVVEEWCSGEREIGCEVVDAFYFI